LSVRPIVLCNAGPLIALGKLNRLEFLAGLYGEVQISRTVYDEVVTQGLARGASDALTIQMFWQRQDWPVVEVPPTVLSAYRPSVILDAGEKSILALAQTMKNTLVLMDDEVARSEARRLKLRTRGTLGVLAQACREQMLTVSQTEFLIREISARRDIWISTKLCDQVLSSLLK